MWYYEFYNKSALLRATNTSCQVLWYCYSWG